MRNIGLPMLLTSKIFEVGTIRSIFIGGEEPTAITNVNGMY
jgi:hypothetical protein